MGNRIEYYWRALQKKLPEEQTFYLFIIMIFTGFWGRRCKDVDAEQFTYQYFYRVVQDIQTYDTKEAAFRLGEKIDWVLLETDEELKEAVQVAFEEISHWLSRPRPGTSGDRAGLDSLLDAVLELAGTTGGYIATPQSVRRLAGELLGGINPESIADFCCGILTFGVDMCRDICRRKKKEVSQISLYGAEMDAILCAVGTMMMEMYGIRGRIEQKDILAPPAGRTAEQQIGSQIEQKDILAPPDESEMLRYDLIILDMPRGTNQRVVCDIRDPRLAGFGRKTVYADWIFIQNVLYHLKDGGYAAVLCTTGVLIRANEKWFREQVIRRDYLEAVITLPPNLYPNTRTGTELLIFHKGKTGGQKGKILFVDISQYYFRERRNAYAISDEGHIAACACYRRFLYRDEEGVRGRNVDDLGKISVIMRCDALDKQTCSWKPIQYIHQEQETAKGISVCLSDIADIVRGAQIVKKDTRDTGEIAHFPDKKASGGGREKTQDPDGTAYFLNIKDIQEGTVRYDTAERLSGSNPACKDKYRIREDDILLTSKGTAIKMAIVGQDPPLAYISGNITLLRVKRLAYDPYVLFHYLDSEKGRISLEQIQSGTTIRILNNTNLMALRVPQYDIEKMQKIGSRLKEKREIFLKKQRSLIENYDTERKILLDLLKEER